MTQFFPTGAAANGVLIDLHDDIRRLLMQCRPYVIRAAARVFIVSPALVNQQCSMRALTHRRRRKRQDCAFLTTTTRAFRPPARAAVTQTALAGDISLERQCNHDGMIISAVSSVLHIVFAFSAYRRASSELLLPSSELATFYRTLSR